MDDDAKALSDLIRSAGEAWVLDWYSPPEKAGDFYAKLLAATNTAYATRFPDLPENAIRPSMENLQRELVRNPHRVKAFVQALSCCRDPLLLVMVWRILNGAAIQAVRLEYDMKDRFQLDVSLESPWTREAETYQSDDIDDAALLRHLGIMKIDRKPVFDGFYPLNLTD